MSEIASGLWRAIYTRMRTSWKGVLYKGDVLFFCKNVTDIQPREWHKNWHCIAGPFLKEEDARQAALIAPWGVIYRDYGFNGIYPCLPNGATYKTPEMELCERLEREQERHNSESAYTFIDMNKD